ncbi:MAG: SAM-dependent DNA methyltransferase [Akkermansia sp.]|nr:SAM-dependent DNA methyltransferase [Akkermansia sp.]
MAKRASKKAKDNTPLPFEKQIWDAACVLWGHIPAADYRKVIIGLIFLRYVSSRFEARYQQLVEEGYGFEDDRDFYSEENIFWVPQEARWSTIAAAAHSPEIGMTIDNAMRAIERENDTLKDVLPKDYAKPELDKRVLGEVVDLFTNLDMGSAQESTDLLGRTYEYCIANFAAYEGTKGGEFYTPASVVKTLVAILKPFENCRVYDPCCGSGGMFVQSARFIEEHSGRRDAISVYGQESNSDTWKMAKINMAIRGISADFGKHHADTFHNDLHKTLKADFILANPPFNLSGWGQEKLQDDVRWKYGTPPAGNANFAWIQHMIHHLAPNGKIGLVLANGAVSSQQSGEGDIRRKIIEADLVEGIVALPTQLFYSVTIPVTLWFISKDKKQKGKTLFIDARKMGTMIDRKHRDFSDEDIARLADTFTAFQNGTLEDVKGFCAIATTDDIAKQDYILTPGRYVGIEEQQEDSEPFDEKMKRLTSELSSLFSRSHELEEQIKNNLKELGYEI